MSSLRPDRSNCLTAIPMHKVLGLTLAVILTASLIPASFTIRTVYALESFKSFDGDDFVDVTSPDLQLPQFTAEVRFRITDLPSERGYLVSKGAPGSSDSLDHNYAMYVTKFGRVGGGFKATDGTYYYVYTELPVTVGAWHVAKLVYDGSELKLKIDGSTAASVLVSKTADASLAGPLRIGANANDLERFFVGDMDYVKILDRSDYTKIYFNGFDSVSPSNGAPVANNDSDSTDENTAATINVLANDNDPDGDALSVTSVTNPPGGSAANNGDGTVTYTPDLDYVGTDTFQYTISDGKGASDTATVSVEVRDVSTTVNNPPNAVNDSILTNKDTSVTSDVLANDSDPDGDAITIVSVTNPPNGSANKNSGGTITYTPDAGFVGTDSYQYTISDGALSDTATVTVTVSDPAPPPPSGSDCSDIPVKNFRGVVFMDKTLGKDEHGGGTTEAGYVAESMKYIKSNGFNAIRVPMIWESYVYNPTDFLNEVELIAKTAQNYDICVFYDNHHYYTTSYWNLDVDGKSDGRGFPSFVVKNFPVRNNDYIDTAGPFWNAFLSNSITVNGKTAWDLQADYFKAIINRVDKYDSVAGYEILNEPHLFDKTHYEKLGNYNTYIAKEIREVSDKKIFFDRETTRGFTREPSLEYKIVPRGVSGLVYAPHLYGIPYDGSQAEKQIKNFKTWSTQWGTEVLIGEMAAETQSDANTYLKVLKEYGFGYTAQSWKRGGAGGLGTVLYESSTVEATAALKIMVSAMKTVWGI